MNDSGYLIMLIENLELVFDVLGAFIHWS